MVETISQRSAVNVGDKHNNIRNQLSSREALAGYICSCLGRSRPFSVIGVNVVGNRVSQLQPYWRTDVLYSVWNHSSNSPTLACFSSVETGGARANRRQLGTTGRSLLPAGEVLCMNCCNVCTYAPLVSGQNV